MRKLINCVMAIISWGYTNGNSTWMYYLVPLSYRDTLQVMYYTGDEKHRILAIQGNRILAIVCALA
jgi:hypothetical protein